MPYDAEFIGRVTFDL